MSENSNISWTDHTFNPWEGCTKVSPGCAHCYAEARNKRFADGLNWGKGAPRRRTSAANWNLPSKWNRAAQLSLDTYTTGVAAGAIMPPFTRPRVFCASLADWLDDEVPIEWLADLLQLIRTTPRLDWLLLTKRPENWFPRIDRSMADLKGRGSEQSSTRQLCDEWIDDRPPANVWVGTTVEDQRRADERIPELLKIPARIRFLSCEPLLDEVNLDSVSGGTRWIGGQRGCLGLHRGIGTEQCPHEPHHHHDERCKKGIDWVIAGGESGPKFRPFDPAWARSLRDQCAASGVAFHMKQMGGLKPSTMPPIPEDLAIRQWPNSSLP